MAENDTLPCSRQGEWAGGALIGAWWVYCTCGGGGFYCTSVTRQTEIGGKSRGSEGLDDA